MIATLYSGCLAALLKATARRNVLPNELTRNGILDSWVRSLGLVLSGIIAFLFLLINSASAAETSLADLAQQSFLTNQSRFLKETNNVTAAWQFGRAAFDWAEYAQTSSQRAEIAEQGIVACRHGIILDPDSGPSHYYLAMNLGQLARTKTLGALTLVDQMEVEFKKARELDEKFDFGGPDRCLGRLYFEAPGWPASIGNKTKARAHLERAVQLFPDFPENRLFLLEGYIKWGDSKAIDREVRLVQQVLEKARDQFKGDEWKQSWIDWGVRWEKMRKKLRLPASRKFPSSSGRGDH